MNEEGDNEDVPDLKLGVQPRSTNNGYQGTSKHDNGSCSRINNFVLTSQRVESDILEETPNAGPSEHQERKKDEESNHVTGDDKSWMRISHVRDPSTVVA